MTEHSKPDSPNLEVRRIDWPTQGRVNKAIVYLHEGLGSVAGWQQFPDQLCASCSLPGLVYSRQGYGQSDPLPQCSPLTPDFLHLAATVELDQLLCDNDIDEAILLGHSDGASIAIIYAGQKQAMKARVASVIAIAPHLFIEPICIDAIEALADKVQEKPERLALLGTQHRDINSLFQQWSSAWLSTDFHDLNLLPEAAAITCPVLAIQGENDQYGTLEQVRQLSSAAPNRHLHVIPDCRHSPHLEARDRLLSTCADFINQQ